jgi:pyruvate dehydrogenase E2 component (dihydrolipoamide acetyltransferase)
MLALSPTMDRGTVARWRKKEGDEVRTGDVLCEVETDKATMDYESTVEGTLLAIIVPEGGSAAVGEPIAVVGKKGDDISALLPGPGAGPGAAPAPKAPPAPAPAAQPAAATPLKTPPAPAPAAAAAGPAPAPEAGGRVRASPLARRMAAARGVPLGAIAGSGPGGRVVKRDVEALAAGAGAGSSTAARPAAGGPPAAAAAAAPPPDQVLQLTAMRRTIAKRMTESVTTAPHYYLTVGVDMEGVLALRKQVNEALADEGREPPDRVSLNAFLMKLAAETLKRHPRVNATWGGDSIVVRGSIDIGLAVALADGLVAPIVRNCGGKRLLDIDRELAPLIERAKAGRLAPEDYTGATFTISNLGSYGIEEFTSIINPPGAAILAVGEARPQPVARDGAVVVRTIMRATLSCDHRVVDGAVGAAFLRDLKRALEHPARALL